MASRLTPPDSSRSPVARARNPITLAELQQVCRKLKKELPAVLTASHRKFLLGLVACEPDWPLMKCLHLSHLQRFGGSSKILPNSRNRFPPSSLNRPRNFAQDWPFDQCELLLTTDRKPSVKPSVRGLKTVNGGQVLFIEIPNEIRHISTVNRASAARFRPAHPNRIPFVSENLMRGGSDRPTWNHHLLAARGETVVCSDNSRPLLADAGGFMAGDLITIREASSERKFGLIQRPFRKAGSAWSGWREPSMLEHGWL